MADPGKIIGGLTDFAGGIGNMALEHASYKARKHAQHTRITLTARFAREQLFRDYSQLAKVYRQKQEQIGAQLKEEHRQFSLAMSSSQVAAARGGVSGGSVQELMSDFFRQSYERESMASRSLTFLRDQLEQEKKSSQQKAIQSVYGVVESVAPADFLKGLNQMYKGLGDIISGATAA
jgi:hypothetical protein